VRASLSVPVVAVRSVLSSAARGIAFCGLVGGSLHALPLRQENLARSEALVRVSRGQVAAADL